jgi:hypothetical protein
MNKRQQWIIGAIAVLAAFAIGLIVYRQYVSVVPGSTFRGDTLGTGSRDKMKLTDAVIEDAIPTEDISPDDVAKGIGDDLLKEEGIAESDVTSEKESATAGAKVLHEYENAYEESNL